MPIDEQKLYQALGQLQAAHEASANERREIRDAVQRLEDKLDALPMAVRDIEDMKPRVRALEEAENRRKGALLGIGIGSSIGGAGLIELLQRIIGK